VIHAPTATPQFVVAQPDPQRPAPKTTTTSSSHIAALDGIRGLAFCMVFAFHFGLDAIPRDTLDHAILGVTRSSWTGVDLFFVLSGFLITGILLDTRGSERYFRNFYARRTLRIFPLYYGILIAALIVVPLLFPRARTIDTIAELRANQAWFWTYTINIRIAALHSWDPAVPGRLMHFWSLAVEEQFYLIWPLIVLLAGRRKLLWVCASIVVLSFIARVLLQMADHGPVAGHAYVPYLASYVLLPARADALAIGAAVACLLRAPGGYQKMRRIAKPVALVSALAVLALALPNGALTPYDRTVQLIGYPLTAILASAIIVLAIDPAAGFARRFCEWRPLRWIGTYAYGMYVFHYPIRYVMGATRLRPDRLFPQLPSVMPGLIVYGTIGFLATLLVATASWRFYEAPILRLKRFFPSSRGGSIAPTTVGVQ
jgi:peptidoglycan/LPS O-acetylase OafA/YrhL